MKTTLISAILAAVLLAGAGQSLSAQDENALVRQLESSALQTANELTEKIREGWNNRGISYIEIATFDYKGFQVPLGQIWARLLQDTLIEAGGTQFRILSADGRDRQTPSYRIKGEILDFGTALTIHTDIISFEDMSIIASIRKVIEKTPEVSSLLMGDTTGINGTVTPDSFEPDSQSQMAPLSLSAGPVRRSLTAGDEDWFRIGPDEAEALTIFTRGEVDTYLTVYEILNDVIGRILVENDDFGEDTNAGATVDIPAGAALAVKITGYDGATGLYTMHLEKTEPLQDPIEPNNNAEEAAQLSVDGTPVQSAFSTSDDIDWFTFTITEGPLFISAYTTGTLDTEMTLYDASYADVGYNDDGSSDYNAEIITRLEPGVYYMELKELDGTRGQYAVAVETRDLTLDQYEPDNSILRPREIHRGETQVHNFIPGRDKDYVTFSLQEAQDTAFYTLGNLDTYLKLFNEDGEIMIEDDDSGSDYNAMITVTLEPGTYYLEVSRVDETVSSENYRLLFR